MECKACGTWFASGQNDGVCLSCKTRLKKMGLDIPYDRLRELVEADKAGRWIPCSSGVMPDAEQEVRVVCKTSTEYRYQCLAVYIPAGVYRDDSGYSWDWECCDEYDEERDDYMVNPGWYESIHNWDDYSAVGIADTVTHWMPLSEMPKEDNSHG